MPRVLERVSGLRARLRTPVVVSPYAHVSASIDPIVEGVIRSSPAEQAGIEVGRQGDQRRWDDGRLTRSRGQPAQARHARAVRPTSRSSATARGCEHGWRSRPTRWMPTPTSPAAGDRSSSPGSTSGVCLPGSFHLQYLRQIHDAVTARRPRRAVVVPLPFFRDLVAEYLAQLSLPEGTSSRSSSRTSRFFGGTVSVGDLWVLEDIEHAMRPLLESATRPTCSCCPNSFLSKWGRDLRGIPYPELEAALGIDVVFIDCRTHRPLGVRWPWLS